MLRRPDDSIRPPRRRGPRPRWLLIAGVLLAGCGMASVSADAPADLQIAAGADATALARRVEPPPGAPGLALYLGDSLGVFGRAHLDDVLVRPGWRVVVNAKGGRSILSDDATLSAVLTVQSIHAQGIDPDLWIVELGTNDVQIVNNCFCTDKVAASVARIRRLLAAIGPGERVRWVNVENFDVPQVAIDYNQALANLVATGEIEAVADWHAIAHERRDVWFADAKHMNSAGYTAWAALIGELFRR